MLPTKIVQIWADSTDLNNSLYPTRLRGGLHRFSVPQETRFPLINPNSRLYTSTEQTLIHIQQGPLPLTVAGSRYWRGQLCFFFNGRSLETLVQNNLYCNKAWLQRTAFVLLKWLISSEEVESINHCYYSYYCIFLRIYTRKCIHAATIQVGGNFVFSTTEDISLIWSRIECRDKPPYLPVVSLLFLLFTSV